MMVGFYSALNPEGRNIMMNITSSSVSWTNLSTSLHVARWFGKLLCSCLALVCCFGCLEPKCICVKSIAYWVEHAEHAGPGLVVPSPVQVDAASPSQKSSNCLRRRTTASELQSQIMAKELGHKQKPQSWASRRIPGPPGDLLGGHLTSGSDATKNIDILNNPSPCLSNCCVSDWSK